MEQLTLTVNGMSCGGCENTVRKAVSGIAGVSSVTASHKDSTVVVEFDATKADRAAIARAIEQAGYQVAA